MNSVYTLWKRIYDNGKFVFVGNFMQGRNDAFGTERNSLDELAEAFSINRHIPEKKDSVKTISCISRVVGEYTDYPVLPTDIISFEKRSPFKKL